jgi:acetyl-CoA acetyltransferase
MTGAPLSALRPVYVAGIGMHPYQFPSETPYVRLGITAVRAALADAGLAWPEVEAAYVGTTGIGMAAGRILFRHLGSTGLAVTQVENASASGSAAFRLACLEVASGRSDVALALGVDKFGDAKRAAMKDGIERLSDTAHVPAVKFALLARGYCREYGATPDDLARVAVKNHGNAARNPFAQFRKPRTLEQVLASARVAGDLTALQCCPRGEGAAAAIVVSEAAIARLNMARQRAVRVTAASLVSETLGNADEPPVVTLAREAAQRVYAEAGIGPQDLDVVELHDAFSVEELIYTEAFGLCAPGEGARFLSSGASAIGGTCAVNGSGGLIGHGHPNGPTGLGQIADIVRQLRGENGERQHPGARIGMAHMIGLGSVAIAHVLVKG